MSQSALDAKIGTNYIPTDEEVVQITQLLSLPMGQMKSIELKMESLLKEYDHLRAQHDLLSLKVDGYKALISPLRRIPVDLIRRIFSHCLPTEHHPVVTPHEAPLLLTHVCSGWRQIALATPTLWASIHIVSLPGPLSQDDHQFTQKLEHQCSLVTQWISRSGSCSLRISLYIPGDQVDQPGYQILQCLVDNCHRWQTVNIDASFQTLAYILTLPSSAFPLLTSLSLTFSSHYGGHPPLVYNKHGILEAPGLVSVSLYKLPTEFCELPLNWDRLTRLFIQGHVAKSSSISDAATVLGLCEQLSELHIETSVNLQFGQRGIDRPIKLPALRKLFLVDDGCNILNFLETPALEHLEFHVTLPQGYRSLPSFLSRHSGKLRTLLTDFQLLTDDEFIVCLQHCPHLSALSCRHVRYTNVFHLPVLQPQAPSIHIGNFDDRLLDLLCIPDTLSLGQVLLPELETLECFTPAQFSDKKLVEFINIRQGGVLPNVKKMKRIIAHFDRPRSHLVVEDEIQQFTGKHFQVDLSYIQPVPNRSETFSPYLGLSYRAFQHQFV